MADAHTASEEHLLCEFSVLHGRDPKWLRREMAVGTDQLQPIAQAFAVGSQGEVGAVVLIGQVGQAGPLQVVAGERDHFGGFAIGDVSAGAGNSVAKKFRVARIGQHVFVVVAFDEQGIECVDAGEHVIEDASQIRPQSKPRAAVVQREGGSIDTVVRRGHRLNRGFADRERFARDEVLDVMHRTEWDTTLGRSQGSAADVNRHVEFAIQDAQTSDVVAVIVRDHDGIDFRCITPGFIQSSLHFAEADARVKEHALRAGVDEDTVAAAS